MSRQTSRRTFLAGAAGIAVAGGFAGLSSAGEHGYTTEDLRIESWDGTELAATLYLPDNDGPSPAVLSTHGWGNDRNAAAVQRTSDIYASHGYVVLTYDSRGFGDSDGQVGIDGPNEVNDAQHLITWLARRDEVLTDSEDNPRIGMDGLSYAGGIQLNTAAVDDRLDAIIPRWAWHDLSHSLGPDDVIKRGWTSLLYAVGTTGSLGLTSGQERPQLNDTTGMTPRLTEIYAESTARNELADRHEAYFKTRSAVSKLDELGKNSPPALFISGLNDVLFTPDEAIWNYDGLRERGVESRLVLFEGAHTLFGATPDADTQAIIDGFALDWMDDHVKRKGNADLPPVTYYDIQSEVFKTTDSIPEPSRDLDLAGTGGQRAGTGEQTVVLNSGEATSSSQVAPRNDDAAPGATAAEFAFDITEDVELLGSPELTLPIQPIGTETKLFAKLYHVEDGEETLIHDQVTPFRLEGTQTREVTQEMVALQRQLAAGDQLKLVIATTDAGFYASRESAGARLLHGEGTLSLPVAGEKSPGKSGQTSAKNKPRADD